MVITRKKSMDTTRTCEQHIEEIRRLKFSIGGQERNPLIQDLHHAVASLSAELYTKDVHFLMELIQNAEDNEYAAGVEPTLEFVLTSKDITGTGSPATLLVFNNEVGFTKANMDSICRVGRSTKKGKRQQGFIGEKGIGFKSVFLVSKWPHVFSNGYQVRFSEEPNRDCSIGYIVPEWVEEKPTVSDIQSVYGSGKILPTTTVILPLRPEKVEAVKQQLSEVHPELLLFLTKIKRLLVHETDGDPNDVAHVSAISISSESNHVAVRAKRADSRVICLSLQEKVGVTEETCQYYMWRQAFPVKPENKVGARKDIEEWVISLAFPFGKRLKRGTSSVGVFAFLPTAMVTNFPFIIQADFILSSSRETILLDNIWNLGILDCVASAFVNAFVSCVKEVSPLSSIAQAFEFLPVRASPFPELNDVRESIRTSVQAMHIMPCEFFSKKRDFCKPAYAMRVLPEFRKLLFQMKEHGVCLDGLSSLEKFVLHSSLDLDEYNEVLDFLEVQSIDASWYRKCIQACNLVLEATEDVYIELLCFIADNDKVFSSSNFMNTPLLKYTDRDGKLAMCSVAKAKQGVYKVRYAWKAQQHDWLSYWNREFGSPNNLFFLPNSTQKVFVRHKRSSSLRHWLLSEADVTSISVCDYFLWCGKFLCQMEQRLTISLAHFLYHSHEKCFIDDSEVFNICWSMPIIDGSGRVRMGRTKTLVPASGSKWVKLFGSTNPFSKENYADLGEVYSESDHFCGECTPETTLLNFLTKYTRAVDLPEISLPNVVLQVASSKLTNEQAFLLLDWIRFHRTKSTLMPDKFIGSIRDGRWMKTCSGFNSPSQSILTNETESVVFEQMKNVLGGFSVIDQEFYTNRMSLYVDELKFLGVGFGYEDVHGPIINRLRTIASSRMSKECAFSLLMFISFSKARNKLQEYWLGAMKEGKWLKTSQGYTAPVGSILLPPEIEANAVLRITNLPVVDEMFYGSKLGCFLSELEILGVVVDLEKAYKLIADNFTFPADLSSMTRDTALVILRCIRYVGSTALGLTEKITDIPWLKTSFGFRSPSESFLFDSQWVFLLNVVEVPVVDEPFYGNEIRSFMAELKAVGVAVDLDSAAKAIIVRLKSLSSSCSLTPANVISLLDCIKGMNETIPSQLLEFMLGEKWLKTRHGYRSPTDSILFDLKWGTISQFVDLPLIDDAFYSIGIYEYKDELKTLGVVVDFREGVEFVAKGLNLPKEPRHITAEGAISLLECVGFLMTKSSDETLALDFVNNLRSNKWLKTHMGYKTPEECLLFDPVWKGVVKPEDGPFIDENFYRPLNSFYRDQLKAIGVKVDAEEVCNLISEILVLHTQTCSIMRIYKFLTKFQWNPEFPNNSNSKVWIPNQDGTGGGEWINSRACVLHDKDNLFGSRLHALGKYYKERWLPIFSSAFGVAEVPSINDYVQLWNDWVLSGKHQVTFTECWSFWRCVLENWNSNTEEILKADITRIPAITVSGVGIYLVEKKDVFIPDDLQLKKMFTEVSKRPLFVWHPNYSSSSSVSPRKLYEIYSSLGVRKISESVQFDAFSSLCLDHKLEKVEARNELIIKGLIKLVLGFLAGPRINMPVKERHELAKALLDLAVFKSNEPITVSYSLLLPSAKRRLNLKASRLVLWDRKSCKLLVHKLGSDDRKTNIEFVTCFAQAVSEGLLQHERADLVDIFCKLIQIGFMFGFEEDAVDLMLMRENLELFKEDMEFLDAAFPSEQSSPGQLKRGFLMFEPSTPLAMVRYKQRRQ